MGPRTADRQLLQTVTPATAGVSLKPFRHSFALPQNRHPPERHTFLFRGATSDNTSRPTRHPARTSPDHCHPRESGGRPDGGLSYAGRLEIPAFAGMTVSGR
jgi:hypothetical protein